MAQIIAPDKRLLDAACFYAKLLGIADKEFTLEIERLDLTKTTDVAGSCEFMREDNDFLIELEAKKANRDGKSIYQVLAHEMVHVKQYITGELEEAGLFACKWQGKLFLSLDNDDFYWESPWEIEAFGREIGLFHRWEKYRLGDYKLKGE